MVLVLMNDSNTHCFISALISPWSYSRIVQLTTDEMWSRFRPTNECLVVHLDFKEFKQGSFNQSRNLAQPENIFLKSQLTCGTLSFLSFRTWKLWWIGVLCFHQHSKRHTSEIISFLGSAEKKKPRPVKRTVLYCTTSNVKSSGYVLLNDKQ